MVQACHRRGRRAVRRCGHHGANLRPARSAPDHRGSGDAGARPRHAASDADDPGYHPEFLAPLLDRLAAYHPAIITIEALSGTECELLRRYAKTYPGVADDYCWDSETARAALHLDTPAAVAAADAMLTTWPKAPAAAQRRRLAALFLAAGDRTSAVVQWLHLPAAERRAGDGLDAAMVAILVKTSEGANENIRIAAALAVRLGLERVHATDDHTADGAIPGNAPAFGAALQAIWSAPSAFRNDYKARHAAVTSPAALLDFYRYMNDPATNRAGILSDMGTAIARRSPELYGRQYVAWWETRNLRMVANIRATVAAHPGARVLSIVGATHKAYFERYLGMMSDIDLADTASVLR